MVDCISATNGIAIEGNPTGGPVCQGDVTLQLAAGGSIQGSSGPSLSIESTDGVALRCDGKIFGVLTNSENIGIFAAGNTGVAGNGSTGPGVEGDSTDNNGVVGISGNRNGVFGLSQNQQYSGVMGRNNSPGIGVYGENTAGGTGVHGFCYDGIGTSGASSRYHGMHGWSEIGYGVVGDTDVGYAGVFFGPVRVTGFLEKMGGGFKIDHPPGALTSPEDNQVWKSLGR